MEQRAFQWKANLVEPPKRTDSQEIDSPDFAKFKERVYRKTGIDLNLYKQQQMQRRLFNMVERAGLRTFQEYFDLLDRDENEFFAFLDRMTINVSELFRNPEKWEELAKQVLPEILKARLNLKIWSAGCSYGAEPYTLTMLLTIAAPNGRHTLHATDIDQKILAKAREGKFTEADVKSVPPELLASSCTPLPLPANRLNPTLPRFQVKPELRSKVMFRPHNLLADRFDKDYDLICCRNVVIYFTDEAKERLYEQFVQSLRVGGYLFVGGTERIVGYQSMGLDNPIPFFYRRVR
jgi:chemotaxis protein methyltransferase CheR